MPSELCSCQVTGIIELNLPLPVKLIGRAMASSLSMLSDTKTNVDPYVTTA